MAAGQVYAQTKLSQLSQTASHPDFVKISDYQFRNITTMSYESPLIAKWALSNGAKKIAVVAIQNDWGSQSCQNFVDYVKANGGEITDVEMFIPGLEISVHPTKVARGKPDVDLPRFLL